MSGLGGGKPGLIKKVASIKRPHIKIDDGTTLGRSKIEILERKFDQLQSELAEYIILESQEESAAVSTYSLTYEQYVELPGNVRL